MVETLMMEIKTKPDEENVSFQQTNPDKKDDGLKEILEEFVQKTSIPAVSLVHYGINIFWKSIWLLIVLFGLIISIYQSVELIKKYRRYPSYLTNVEKINTSLYMPSITLCNQNLVNWKKMMKNNHSLFNTIEQKMAEMKAFNKSEWKVMPHSLRKLLMNNIFAMDADEREEILTNISDWMDYYYGYDAEGSQFAYQHNSAPEAFTPYSPRYGKCITINPGFTEESKLRMSTKTDITILAKINPEMAFPYLDAMSSFLLSIHAPGTAPVLGWHKSLEILPGELVKIGIKVTDIQRLPSPYTSNCIDERKELSQVIHEYSPYRSKETPYSYSREECMATCYLMGAKDKKNCYLSDVAVKKTLKLQDKENKIKLCDDIFINLFLSEIYERCSEDCRKHCRELLYDWTAKSTVLKERTGSALDYMYIAEEGLNITNFIGIILKMDSNSFIYIEETPKYQLEDIFGSIGGNLGLWIGLSILSAFEIFELLTNIMVHLIRKMMKFKRN